ncbi:MAG: glycosyltransferase family 4 protein [Spirochaetia bacterium]|jgi:glycosyltransferase involved in cell wall biosynthesis|nr:glycosyltransferase family 4 protein [Spirochaetia bacterium]
MKRVLICHYRVGRTDGVSLEITKRASVLEEMGYKVYLLAGSGSDGADFIIPELDFDRPEVRKIADNSFKTLKNYTSEQFLMEDIDHLAGIIAKKLKTIIEKINPDFILIHNILSHGRHIASALAFYNVLQESNIPSLATHHDFFWERDDFKEPSCKAVDQFLKKYVPPVLPGLEHAVISTRAAASLFKRSSIDAVVIPDTLDFTMAPWEKDEFNKDFLKTFDLSENDILVLQATRIVRRKGIELILPILEKLNDKKYLGQLYGKQLYNGKRITETSKFVYLIAGYAEQEAEEYLQAIISYLEESNIPYRNIQSKISAERELDKSEKKFSIFDTYAYADIVSYPSLFEGWGNQFIEAVFARKPVMIYEYPVFKTDIKSKGYEVISLGSDSHINSQTGFLKLSNDIIESVCSNVVETLLSSETSEKLGKNFKIAEENNSRDTLKVLMGKSMVHV